MERGGEGTNGEEKAPMLALSTLRAHTPQVWLRRVLLLALVVFERVRLHQCSSAFGKPVPVTLTSSFR